MSMDGCGPPVVSKCSTAVWVQGWPQSPIPPFPDLEHDSATNTFTLTAKKDWPVSPPDAPGPKAVHFLGLGFTNPEQAGAYPIKVSIRPDPSSDRVVEGEGEISILESSKPFIAPNSQANGKPPPPFANTMFQTIPAGETSLNMAFYLWDAEEKPMIGVNFQMDDNETGQIIGGDGKSVGELNISAPEGANQFRLVTDNASGAAKAFLTGIATGRLVTRLETDPSTKGEYVVKFSLHNGNTITHTIVTQ